MKLFTLIIICSLFVEHMCLIKCACNSAIYTRQVCPKKYTYKKDYCNIFTKLQILVFVRDCYKRGYTARCLVTRYWDYQNPRIEF